MSTIARVLAFILLIHNALFFTKVTYDYDLYGIKMAINDYFTVSADNILLRWFIFTMETNKTHFCEVNYSQTTCDFVYSIVVPISNTTWVIYNCVNLAGNHVVGFFTIDSKCNFQFNNETTLSNYSTQDNLVIAIDANNTGIYGFADDFIYFYQLKPPFSITIWPNSFNISPRAIDIGLNTDYGVLVGYCQYTPSTAYECGSIIRLNQSYSNPQIATKISLKDALQVFWSDIRFTRVIAQSRTYSTQTILSVSISWHLRLILIGAPSYNIVLLYAFDNVSQVIAKIDNGMYFTGFGKSVAWLGQYSSKAVILDNRYTRSTIEWVSSSVKIYEVDPNGFANNGQPIYIYPNSLQTILRSLSSVFIELACSIRGDLLIFDNLGNPGTLFSTSAGSFPDTTIDPDMSIAAPCIAGTHRDYAGIELCAPCPNGTYSSACVRCNSSFSFCPYGSVTELADSTLKSIEQIQDYPDSVESTVFDDILMHNMFMLNWVSTRCALKSPMTWVLALIIFGIITMLILVILESHYASTNKLQNRIKQILKKTDFIGEGEVSCLFFTWNTPAVNSKQNL